MISTRSWGVNWLVTNDYWGSRAVFYETPRALYYNFICEQPHMRRSSSLRPWVNLLVFFSGEHCCYGVTRDEQNFQMQRTMKIWKCILKKGWLQYMAPVVVVDIDCPRTTIYRSLSPQTPPSLIPFFHHYFTKVFPPIAKRCTVMFSWWNIIWSTNWRVFTLPEILRLASFFLFRI